MISVLDRRVPAGGRTPDRDQPWVSARAVGDSLLVASAALVVYLLHGTHGYLERDLGAFLYGGERVAAGVPPYTGIFNSVGPLADAVPGLGVWVGSYLGLGSVTAVRLLFLLLSVACVVTVGVLARRTLRSRAAGFVAAAVFLTFLRFLELASDGPREKTTMVLALTLGLVFLDRRRFLPAGACTALATLTWQPALAPMVVAGVVAVALLGPGRRRDAAVAFVVGGIIPSVLAVAWFALTGTLHTAVDGFVLVNLLYTHQPSPLLDPHHSLQLLWSSYRWSLLLVPVGLVALVGLAVRHRRLRVPAAGAVTATAWSAAVLNGGPDLFVVLPFAALGVSGLAVAATSSLSPRPRHAALALVVVLAVVAAGVESVHTRSILLDVERADLAGVLATQPADAGVVSIDAPEVLALSGRVSPTPYQLLTRPIERYLGHRLTGGMSAFAGQISALHPTFVAVGGTYAGTWPDRMLATDYQRVGRGPGWIWYLNRSAGRAALLRARAANATAMATLPGGTRFGAHAVPGQSPGA